MELEELASNSNTVKVARMSLGVNELFERLNANKYEVLATLCILISSLSETLEISIDELIQPAKQLQQKKREEEQKMIGMSVM